MLLEAQNSSQVPIAEYQIFFDMIASKVFKYIFVRFYRACL